MFASNLSLLGRVHVVFLCTSKTKSRKRLACDVFDSFAKHASPVHDVTDSDPVMQTDGHSSHGHVFCHFQTWILNRRGVK